MASESVLNGLKRVRKSLEHRRFILDSAANAEAERLKQPFYIHVESRPVKKDRQAYIAALEKEKQRLRKIKERRGISSGQQNKKLSFTGAPFRVQCKRFTCRGLHPNLIKTGEFQHESPSADNRLPSITSDKAPSSFQQHANFWKPEHFHKELILTHQQRELKAADKKVEANRGPGYYNLPEINKHVQMTSMGQSLCTQVKRGRIHRTLVKRVTTTPGPGTYHPEINECQPRDGIPMFESSLGHKAKHLVLGSGLAPGLHNTDKGTIGERAKIKAGLKGQFHSCSRDRFGQFCTIACAETAKTPHLGPGSYNPKYQYKEDKVDFRNRAKEQDVYIRNWGFARQSMELHSVNTSHSIGIDPSRLQVKGSHTVSTKPSGVTQKSMVLGVKWADKFGFLSSSKLRDKIIEETWPMNNYMTGPGRYTNERYDNLMKCHTGHSSVFKSTAPQRMEFGHKHPDQLAKERNRANFKRKKARLDKVIAKEMAFHRSRKLQ